MPSHNDPFVSIITPVFNNRDDLGQCIESVLAQTYQKWDYTILDNCSDDGSTEIAQSYAARDSRIRVYRNREVLRAIPNHNAALRQLSPESKYCKVVFADDWLFPRCLEEMVALAEREPTVGIVGAYGLQGHEVMWSGLPYPSSRVPGRELCRRMLLDGLYVFGTATSLLYRSDLVRSRDPFYNEGNLHADMEVCLELLKGSDFGFVHQVLTFKRVRSDSLGSITEELNTLIAGHLQNLVSYGREFLSPKEFEVCRAARLKEYYNFLAVNLMRGRRESRFWQYHRRKLNEAGVGFSKARLTGAMVTRVGRALVNPAESIGKLILETERRRLSL